VNRPAEADPRSPEAIRKEAQRLREIGLGIERREVKQSARERDVADFCAQVRGGDTPYTFNEYVNTLIRRDYDSLLEQLKTLNASTCEQCGRIPPTVCGGRFPGSASCWALRGRWDLML
jgi:hypothetical protein